MGIVKGDDVAGYRIDGELVCGNCIDNSELREITVDQVITREECDRQEDFFFCDRCREQL